jgi:hypothetical protein
MWGLGGLSLMKECLGAFKLTLLTYLPPNLNGNCYNNGSWKEKMERMLDSSDGSCH